MAHELEILQNGEASTFFVGDVPWHKLGKRLIKAPTVEEGIVAAGLNWTVGLKDLITVDGQEVDHRATVRESDGSILGVVGPGYKPLQNLEAFNFFNPFLQAGLASLETAGALFNGKRVWILAKINRDPSVIVKGDEVQKYILLSNSHDGTLAVRVGFTPVRVVCNNTLSMAMGGADTQLIRVRHSGKVAENLAKLGEIMDAANAQFEATADQYRELAKNQISSADLERLVKVVFTPAKADDEGAAKRILENVIPLFEHGRGNDMPGVAGTYWGAYNAITEYLQYERGRDEQSRLNQLWFGQSATLSKRALETAMEMIKAA